MLIGGQRDKVCRQLPSRSTTGDLTDAKGIDFRNFANCGLSRIDQKIINPLGVRTQNPFVNRCVARTLTVKAPSPIPSARRGRSWDTTLTGTVCITASCGASKPERASRALAGTNAEGCPRYKRRSCKGRRFYCAPTSSVWVSAFPAGADQLLRSAPAS
jgi:hypothetical protein